MFLLDCYAYIYLLLKYILYIYIYECLDRHLFNIFLILLIINYTIVAYIGTLLLWCFVLCALCFPAFQPFFQDCLDCSSPKARHRLRLLDCGLLDSDSTKIDKIVSGWARDLDTQRALDLGFKAENNFDEIINVYIEDDLKK